MTPNIAREIAALQELTTSQLRDRYEEVYGEPTNARHREWLIRRIAWRLQAVAEGGLSERARRRAADLANEADLRVTAPKARRSPSGATLVASAPPANSSLPPPGSILTRMYKGQELHVKVLPNGFEHLGQVYRSLSAVAKAITGSHCSGNLFFGLTKKGAAE